jgi:hypothetical protein
MSIEEFANLEIARINSEAQKKAVKEWKEAYHAREGTTNEEDEAAEEVENLECRKWDDWEDLNPRGSGNKNRNVGSTSFFRSHRY